MIVQWPDPDTWIVGAGTQAWTIAFLIYISISPYRSGSLLLIGTLRMIYPFSCGREVASQDFFDKLVEGDTLRLRRYGGFSVQLGGDRDAECTKVFPARLLSGLAAHIQVVVDGVAEHGLQLVYGLAVESQRIRDSDDLADEDFVFRTVSTPV